MLINPSFQPLFDAFLKSDLKGFLKSDHFANYLLVQNGLQQWQLTLQGLHSNPQMMGADVDAYNVTALSSLFTTLGTVNTANFFPVVYEFVVAFHNWSGGLRSMPQVLQALAALGAPAITLQALQSLSGTVLGAPQVPEQQEHSGNGHGNGNSAPESGILIFISHAHDDEAMVAELVDLIEDVLDIESKEIRCTSVHGYKLPPGAHTSTQLKTELNHCAVVLGIITPSSIQSNWVLFELGAAWAMEKAWALRGKAVNYGDIPGPLKQSNALKLDDSGDVLNLLQALGEVTGRGLDEDLAKINRKVAGYLAAVGAED